MKEGTAPLPVVLEGARSVEAALRAGSRPIERILVASGGQRAQERNSRLHEMARRHHVPIQRVEPEQVTELASGRTHGGVVALAGERRFVTVDQLVEHRRDPFLVMLDGVEDPFNLGQALRSLYAAGTDGVILRDRRWEAASGVVARASAGASELMPIALAGSAEEAAAALRARNFRIACTAARPSALAIDEANLRGAIFLLIGGERRGVTRSFLGEADLVLRIRPGRHDAPDLGIVASAAVIGYEALRQRRGVR